jgi:hypothetical protein
MSFCLQLKQCETKVVEHRGQITTQCSIRQKNENKLSKGGRDKQNRQTLQNKITCPNLVKAKYWQIR